MHPSQDIKGIKSNFLQNKRIVLGVTGSIAAVETIKLARELIRHGADVLSVMTPAATKIIHPDALWFATGKKPIIQLTGDTEHVSYCGNVKDPVDLLLISPCTANTLSKIANGIDDTAVTTFATTAIGAKHKVLIVPAMHRSMYNHHIVQQNISILKKNNISFVDPFLEMNKAKLASIDEICAQTIRLISSHTLENKKILIIGGSCCEPIDAVRSLCNHSSGKTAISFAKHVYHQGGDVVLWYGKSPEQVPNFISEKGFQTIDDVKDLINETDMEKFDIIIVCAALSDFIPENISGKIGSDKESLIVTCKQADKILEIIREKTETSIIVGFKLGTDEKSVLKKAQILQKEQMLDYVIANTTSAIGTNDTDAWIIKRSKIIPIKGSKVHLAESLFNEIISK